MLHTLHTVRILYQYIPFKNWKGLSTVKITFIQRIPKSLRGMKRKCLHRKRFHIYLFFSLLHFQWRKQEVNAISKYFSWKRFSNVFRFFLPLSDSDRIKYVMVCFSKRPESFIRASIFVELQLEDSWNAFRILHGIRNINILELEASLLMLVKSLFSFLITLASGMSKKRCV